MSEITEQVRGWSKVENNNKDVIEWVSDSQMSKITLIKKRPHFKLIIDFPNGFTSKFTFMKQGKAFGKALYYMRRINDKL